MLIVAHRGASGVCGEANTLRAFRRAIDLRCDFIELDVRRLADGTLVCYHDAAFQDIPLAEMSLADLRARTGIDVPLLTEAAEVCRARIGLDVELKEAGYEQQVIDQVLAHAGTSSVVFKSFNEACVKALAARTERPVGLLIGGVPKNITPDYAALAQQLKNLGAAFLSPHQDHLGHGITEAPALKGLPLYVWTVNEVEGMRACDAAQVAALVTDRPDWALALKGRAFHPVTTDWITTRAADAADTAGMVDAFCRLETEGRKVPTAHVSIRSGSSREVGHWACALWGAKARLTVVWDKNIREAVGAHLLDDLPGVHEVILQPLPGWDKLTPHASISERLQRESAASDALIAVGSGTVNDLVKHTAFSTGKPYLAVASAASMNGYTSSIAALLVDDLKRTLPSQPPVLVLGELDILARAPRMLTLSGYADLLSKYVATADWKLGSLVADETFSELPGVVVGAALDQCVAHAEGLNRQQPDSVDALMQALVLSGFAMSLAGASSPASGGEHLISHLLDMQAYAAGRLPQLHGLQVGLGTLLTARLYELVRDAKASSFKPAALRETDLATAHGKLWPVVRTQATTFLKTGQEAEARVEFLRERWSALWEALDPMLVPANRLKEYMTRAGVPTRPEELDLTRAQLRFALKHGADVRARYTILHLTRDIGLADDLLDQAMTVFDE